MTDQMMERLVAPDDLAAMLSVTTGQLAQMRYLGTGPQYVKVGTRVRYALSDVQTWLTEHRRSQT
ncbi:helix-turn-helix transcriptional regulator [Aeromicrobium stalagmiti]|uniref:helix-turn-helix transcriptional regulator n=1 Tax=Aeromicrobium stalagmiti TaxID=2738988 RepID=UPI00156881B4|nr:DNA-binding protein [Aeromicrobium stalagmiti]NRQ49202.1 DNA-binding protein [Aeromicrobium stalagmiti]